MNRSGVFFQDASKSFFGLVALKMMPMRLALLLLKTGLARLFFSFSKYTSVTLQETLDSLTANKELHLVLSYIGGDYGGYLSIAVTRYQII